MVLGPVLISATALPPRMTLLIGVFAVVCTTLLVFFHYQLPWEAEEPLQLPETYVVASGSRSCWRSAISASTRGKSPRKPVSSQTRLPRPNWSWRANSIFPNSTASPPRQRTSSARRSPPSPSWSREIERALDPNSPHAEDVKLLREQAQRCREILAKITELPTAEPFDHTPLSALIEEAVAPHRNFGVSLT